MPGDAEALFSAAGHDVETVLGEQSGGESDPRVIDAGRAESRILVTLDTDFADIRQCPPSDFPGIWVLRSPSQSVASILSLLRGALAVSETEPVLNRLWIVEAGRVRIHE